MTPEQFARVEKLFEDACAQPMAHRSEWLRAACADDLDVMRKVEGMLAQDAKSLDALEAPALGAGFHVANVDDIERRLREEFVAAGRFRIVSLLGEGGFGSVYRAEQVRPVRRDVALKVIKLGMDTRRVLARFEAERQTLAMMNHPGIAKLIDAGVTESGRSYFIMDLVEGRPITTYCDDARLDVGTRLMLFIDVCEAVRHAHQRGILHRDIKPSNVLVAVRDGNPTPLVIDFGIARAMSNDDSAGSLVTEQGQMIGTPEYMSPEQAGGERDIDTRTDIYSLGVLLYELLTGTTPLERGSFVGAGFAELQRFIREHEPPTPSTRVQSGIHTSKTITSMQHGSAASLAGILKGDLDWIIMKAIEKNRALRYDSADALIADITRFQKNEPVSARPHSATYRFRKFARRNRGALAAGMTMVLLLIAGMIGTGIGMFRAQREAEKAISESAIAQAVSDFLNHDLLTAVADRAKGRDLTMRETLDAASQKIEGKFPHQPAVEIAIRCSLGRAYHYLGEIETATRHLESAVQLSRKPSTANAPKYRIEALLDLADLRNKSNHPDEAEALLNEALPQAIQFEGESGWFPLLILNTLAQTNRRLNRSAEAERLYQRVIALRRAMGDDVGNQRELLTAMSNLATLYYRQNRLTDAEPIMREVLNRSTKVLGPEHAVSMKTSLDLGSLLCKKGQLSQADAIMVPLLSLIRRSLGEHHPHTFFVTTELAELRKAQGRWDDALALSESAVDIARVAFGEASDQIRQAINRVISLCDEIKRPQDAARWRARLLNSTPTTAPASE